MSSARIQSLVFCYIFVGWMFVGCSSQPTTTTVHKGQKVAFRIPSIGGGIVVPFGAKAYDKLNVPIYDDQRGGELGFQFFLCDNSDGTCATFISTERPLLVSRVTADPATIMGEEGVVGSATYPGTFNGRYYIGTSQVIALVKIPDDIQWPPGVYQVKIGSRSHACAAGLDSDPNCWQISNEITRQYLEIEESMAPPTKLVSGVLQEWPGLGAASDPAYNFWIGSYLADVKGQLSLSRLYPYPVIQLVFKDWVSAAHVVVSFPSRATFRQAFEMQGSHRLSMVFNRPPVTNGNTTTVEIDLVDLYDSGDGVQQGASGIALSFALDRDPNFPDVPAQPLLKSDFVVDASSSKYYDRDGNEISSGIGGNKMRKIY